MSATPPMVSRRGFLKSAALVGGGLVLGFRLTPKLAAAEPGAAAATLAPNAFLRITPSGAVTVLAKHSEMGQGIYTSIAMCVAEELDADWTKVVVEAAPTAQIFAHTAFGIQMTGGSTSTWESYDQMRKAGATARKEGDATAAFGAATTKIEATFDFPYLAHARIDSEEKVTGRGVFGIDVKVPGALTALVARPPIFGGKVKSFDATAAKKVAGVKGVVAVPSGVAVLADGVWAAKQGREALKVEWDLGALATLDSVTQGAAYAALANQPGATARKEGDATAAFGAATTKIEATFDFPYLAHAAMEPLNATAHVRPDGVEVWAPTQFQGMDVQNAARAAGTTPDKVTIHTTLLGGGFGRKANPTSDFIVEAVEVSKAAGGVPVRVVWLREDDMRGGFYRPRTLVTAKLGLGADGKLTTWETHIVNQSIIKGTAFEPMMFKDNIDATQVEGLADLPYAVPNLRVDYHVAPVGVPVLWWRSVGHSFSAFVKETLIDDAARAAKQDPIDYRIALLAEHPRQVAILKLLREKSNWGKAQQGHAQGVAIHESFGSIVGQVAEISVAAGGVITVHKVTAVVDCGTAVNPAGVRAQVMSAVVYGMSAALQGKISFKDGQVEQSNFHDYPVARIADAPVVETYIIDSGAKMGGIGEPGTPPIAPAIANAVLAATGKRLRTLPLNLA
ncbi:MAG: xanthine dehydrogenase family protein molybdopterin-binding subunit [Verrucomicrobia bacterium]|nr:xanthine dehydrogenase family protein molybdopterin-binding subunit [Verrucomicrobiota bacterium]